MATKTKAVAPEEVVEEVDAPEGERPSEFEVAATPEEDRPDRYPFHARGTEQTLWARRPKDVQLTYLMSKMTGRRAGTLAAAGSYLDFFMSVLDDDAADIIEERILDPDDDFEIDDVQEILEGLMEQWSGRPTRSSSGSTGSPPPTGPRSTGPARVKASKRQRSQSTAS
jgi:hypothetical protein